MSTPLVILAEKYLDFYHVEKRKGGNQDPYPTHPRATRDILVRYGYADDEHQCTALLHDGYENTKLNERKDDIEGRFGVIIHSNIFILSRNAVGRDKDVLDQLFKSLGVPYLDSNNHLTDEAYKIRLSFARRVPQRVKIADTIHNTGDLPTLDREGIERKIHDSETFYIPLGLAIAPIMTQELIRNIETYKQSKHYKQHFER